MRRHVVILKFNTYSSQGISIENRLRILESTARSIPANVPAILLAAEYFLAQPTPEGGGHVDYEGGVLRQLSETEKVQAENQVRRISAAFPHLLIIPGTIAFRKSAVRSQNVFREKMLSRRITQPQQIFQRYSAKAARRPRIIRDLRAAAAAEAANLKALNHDPYVQPMRQTLTGQVHSESPVQHTYDDAVRAIGRGDTSHFVRNTAVAFVAGTRVAKIHKQYSIGEIRHTYGLEDVFAPGVGPPVFGLDGGLYGVEICTEHDSGVLEYHLPAAEVDCHIILSDTTTVDNAQVRAREGGYVLHACSEPTWSGVFRRRSGQIQPVQALRSEPAFNIYEVDF